MQAVIRRLALSAPQQTGKGVNNVPCLHNDTFIKISALWGFRELLDWKTDSGVGSLAQPNPKSSELESLTVLTLSISLSVIHTSYIRLS